MSNDPWHAWRWEYIGIRFMLDEVKAGRASMYWVPYLSVADRWASALLGPRLWKEPDQTPPVDAYARWRAAGMP